MRHSSGLVRLEIPCKRNRDWEHRILLSSDRHLDSPYSDRELQRRHLEAVKSCGGLVLDFGDLFDAMQGIGDPRASKQALRPELLEGPYWDRLVDEAYSFLSPYADHIAMIGRGNHEYRVVEKAETDLVQRLADRLHTPAGNYRGFVEISYRMDNNRTSRYVLYYTHGSGGGGEVTRGVIRTNRRAVYVPDADIIVSGHVHESWIVEVPRLRLRGPHVCVEPQYHLQLPSYKQEALQSAWWDMKDYAPKVVGAWWLVARYSRTEERVLITFERAL